MQTHSSHAREFHAALSRLAKFGALFLLLVLLPLPVELFAGVASYLPLHSALETLSIVASGLVFAAGWSTPRKETPRPIIILSCVLFWVAVLDFSHMLSYSGMPDFITPNNPEKAIQLWLSARFLCAFGLLYVSFSSWKYFGSGIQIAELMIGISAAVFGIHSIVFVHPEWIPTTFIDGIGLTPFKRNCEYVLVALYSLSALRFYLIMRKSRAFNASGFMVVSILLAMGEFLFTLYANVMDLYNLAGHLYKAAAAVYLYRAVFVDTVQQPYQRLHESQSQLKAILQALPDPLFELD